MRSENIEKDVVEINEVKNKQEYVRYLLYKYLDDVECLLMKILEKISN